MDIDSFCWVPPHVQTSVLRMQIDNWMSIYMWLQDFQPLKCVVPSYPTQELNFNLEDDVQLAESLPQQTLSIEYNIASRGKLLLTILVINLNFVVM